MKFTYEQIEEMMKEVGFKEYQIKEKIEELKLKEGWEPITFSELKRMTSMELQQVKCICWKNGKLRCSSVGIYDLKLIIENDQYVKISWSDMNGDPSFRTFFKETDLCERMNEGQTWEYGLFKKKI